VQADDFDYAVAQARLRHKAARASLTDDIRSHNASATPDEALQLAIRSLELIAASLSFAARIWEKSIAQEKASAALRAQFHEFPEAVVDRTLYEATLETR
jgi:hypothetical protein